MKFKKIYQLIFAINVMLLCCLMPATAEVVRTDLSKLELLVDKSSVTSGAKFNIVFELEPDQGWHAYWENPGDAGLKLEMNWNEIDGVQIGDLQFTTPHLIPFEEIVSYGYDGKVTIIAEVSVSDDYSGPDIALGGDAFWLICSDTLCVPQEAAISTVINVGEDAGNQRGEALVNAAKADMPETVNWPSVFYTDGENFSVKAKISKKYEVIESAYLFPRSEGMMENIYAQDLSFINGEIIGRFKNAYGYVDNDEFEYVLRIKTGEGEELALSLAAQETLCPFVDPIEEVAAVTAQPDMGLMTALAFAFLGGLILNLMPCVFPILSLKAMSVAGLSQKDPKEARLSGLLYTAGVLLCFGIIGAFVNGLSVGWGFHMQMPVVNFILGLLMVTIGLNLFGVFEFGSSLAGMGQGLVKGSNRQASFFTGFLAVIVATPCTAPFMAGALGFAFISGDLTGWLVFLMLGLGLAFPYLLLCYSSVFRAILPRPGAWMENMRTILGFPMLATALWLFWIMGNQVGINAMTLALTASLLLGMALWAFSKCILWKLFSGFCMVGVLFSGFYLSGLDIESKNNVSEEGGLNAASFNSDELRNLINQKQAVFVYFTADWCVTCKLNERIALSQDLVHKAFEDNDIKVMVGDWTNQNPDITKTLQSYGRIGVPLYLYFPSGRSIDNPDILPQILTPDIVIEAL
ncbi:MAG: hypothetical protein HOM63_09165 [Kordiimonadaceae bacterium]|nr:hypothetical protein [Kordiimonadaceae bacterium]